MKILSLIIIIIWALCTYECTPPAEQKPVDLGLTKADVLGVTEEGGVTKVHLSLQRADISKLTGAGSNVTFEQKGDAIAMRRPNGVGGEWDCSCASVGGDAATGGCRAVVIGNFLNCQTNGCTGTCNLTIVINDLKAFVKFW